MQREKKEKHKRNSRGGKKKEQVLKVEPEIHKMKLNSSPFCLSISTNHACSHEYRGHKYETFV